MENSTNNAIVPMNGRIVTNNMGLDDSHIIEVEAEEVPNSEDEKAHPNFIESNTSAITLDELTSKCIIPTFADNTLTISHQNFIASVINAAEKVFGPLTPVEIRVSHPINGRTPQAQFKKPSELTDEDKTLFYQRMAFCCHVEGLVKTVNDQPVHLCIGGVRSYSEDKLYNRPMPQKFRVFVGWQVRVCSNMMLTCDGNSGTIEAMTEADILQKAINLFNVFDPIKESTLDLLENLNRTRLSEELFCKIVGRLRLYQFLPQKDLNQLGLPKIFIGDQAANAMVKNYVENPNFGKREGEDITCWNLMQLANEAVKQTYIDRWPDRNQNCTDFAIGIQKALDGQDTENYNWFLQ